MGGTESDRELPRRAGELLERVRARGPRVHVLTSPVAARRSADTLAAVGAEPSMTARPRDLPDFLAAADALVVNLGMLEHDREIAVDLATAVAEARRLPWLLDPVKLEMAGARGRLARTLLARSPAAVRLNRREAAHLAGRGPAEIAAGARRLRTVLAVTGPVDLVTDGHRRVAIARGTPRLDRITATGCALSALAGAFLAVEADAFLAIAAALLVFAVAAEVADARAAGPGTLAVHLLDALADLDPATLREGSDPR